MVLFPFLGVIIPWTTPSKTARTGSPLLVAMRTPLLFILMLGSIGDGLVPKRNFTTPLATGQGNFPLLAVKLAANIFCSGVIENVLLLADFPAFLLDAAMASRINFLISLSNFSEAFCFCSAFTCEIEADAEADDAELAGLDFAEAAPAETADVADKAEVCEERGGPGGGRTGCREG